MVTHFPEDDNQDLERLIGGRGDEVRAPELRRLARLLRAAAAPARPHELRGEDDAVAAFRSGRRDPPAAARRAGVCLPALVAAAVILAVTVGSAAAVMCPGLVPNPLVDFGRPIPAPTAVVPSPTARRAEPAARPADEPRSPSALPAPTATVPPRTSAAAAPRAGLPVPSVRSSAPATTGSSLVADLCTRYRALDEAERPRALAAPLFTPLVGLAGGADSVGGYCDRTLGSRSTSPSVTPSPSASSPSPTPSPSPSASSSATSPQPSQEISSACATATVPTCGPRVSDDPDRDSRTIDQSR